MWMLAAVVAKPALRLWPQVNNLFCVPLNIYTQNHNTKQYSVIMELQEHIYLKCICQPWLFYVFLKVNLCILFHTAACMACFNVKTVIFYLEPGNVVLATDGEKS